MFGRKKPKKRVVVLTREETRLFVTALMTFRNKLIRLNKPTEDVDAILLQIV